MSEPNLALREAVFMYLYRKDYNIKLEDVVEQTGVSEQDILDELVRLGVPLEIDQLQKYATSTLDVAILLHLGRETNGMSVQDIANKTGIHRSALYNELKRRGILDLKSLTPDHKYDMEKAIELILNRQENKYRLIDIELETGVSKSSLYRELENRGIKVENGNRKTLKKTVEKALSLYEDRNTNGLSVRQIISQTGVSRSTLYAELKKKQGEKDE
ncbi:helix-turn-helix domain-containing protein [Bacillus toyonensis]|uniref:helix-turn-helix domain-containing protein n=1 Tax=Bacillus toyonensis TaxID=155322 RepID=UPI000BF6F6A9|nr:helix-turn-helix domain-containing protein [Bacillus toyonensis]PGF05189.1 transcriptional regulator [Bacillus toyonensis]